MKIIILGAGHVGGSLARILADEANDITLIDENAEKLKQTRVKIMTMTTTVSDHENYHFRCGSCGWFSRADSC